MVIGGMRGTGNKTQARCIQQALIQHNVMSSSIDVGTFHCEGIALRCEVCQPPGDTPTSDYCTACPAAIDLDRLYTVAETVEFVQGSQTAIVILLGRNALSVDAIVEWARKTLTFTFYLSHDGADLPAIKIRSLKARNQWQNRHCAVTGSI